MGFGVVVTVSDSGAITISMFMKALKVAEAPARWKFKIESCDHTRVNASTLHRLPFPHWIFLHRTATYCRRNLRP